MRLQDYAPSTIKSYKEYVMIFVQAMRGYQKLSLISIIEAFLKKKVLMIKLVLLISDH